MMMLKNIVMCLVFFLCLGSMCNGDIVKKPTMTFLYTNQYQSTLLSRSMYYTDFESVFKADIFSGMMEIPINDKVECVLVGSGGNGMGDYSAGGKPKEHPSISVASWGFGFKYEF